ncbi:OmpA/MotB family protein [Pleionea sediminis]|uniref:OmpA/MotB family protein n=1 Tax=Pleionea sediminis TaxID=2569479 RepID=UPI0011869331|nr:OmpA family protein [Pleionea sediminis]
MKNSENLHPIERLLTQSKHHHGEDGWLLPYLDVFILLTMMFIVLLSLSSYDLTTSLNQVEAQAKKIDQLQEKIEPLRQLEQEGRSSIVLEHWQERVHQVLDSIELRDDIALTLDDDYIAIQIEDKMLFDSGKATLKPEGEQVLSNLLPVFQLSAGTILVEGHTDNVPIDTSRFPSNWELGASRASSVVKFLVSQGMKQNKLRAISYADTKPLASNETEEGRQKNRRVALLLQMPDTE